jgi:AbrB family looped-hinge helix DNA binding protein
MKRSVTRRLDDLGRIVIPSDFREELGMEPGEKVEIYIEEGRLVLKKTVKIDSLSEINSLKERISKAYDIAWNNDVSSPSCPEYEEMHKALKAVMDALRGE